MQCHGLFCARRLPTTLGAKNKEGHLGFGRLLVWSVIGCLLSFSTKAEQYSSPGLGALHLDVPNQWRVLNEPGPITVYLRILPEAEARFNLEITSSWWPREKLAALTMESIKERVERVAGGALPNTIEVKAQLIELKGKESAGYYFQVANRKPPPGTDYKYLTQGVLLTKVGITGFTLLHREPEIPERQQVLEMLAGATYSNDLADSNGPSQSDTVRVSQREEDYQVWMPTSRVYLSIPRTRYLAPVTERGGGATNNPRYYHFSDRAFNVSGWFEPARKFSGIQKFWESETNAWRQDGQRAPVDVVFKTIGNWDAVVYDLPSPSGTSSHIRAHGLQAGTWIDIHLSLASNRPSAQNRETLETYLKGVFVRNRAE